MEVLSSRVLYRSSNFDALRQFYEQTVGLHVYREYGASEEVCGVVFFLGGGFLEDYSGIDILFIGHPLGAGARWPW